MWHGAYAQAQRCHDDALALFSESGDQPGVAHSLFRLGFLADRRGDYVAATKHLEQSLRICQDLADDLGVDMACNRLGIIAWNQGEYERAVEALERSLAFQRDREAPGACAATLLNLGALMLERGDPSRAMILLQESLALNQTLHDTFALAYVQTYIGYAALCRHELQVTKQAFCEALAVLDPESAPEITCRLLDGIARLSAQQGRTVHATRIWGGMDTFRTRHGCAFRPVEQHRHEVETAAARRSIGTLAFVAAWREGCALSLTDLLIEAKSSLGWRENVSASSEAPVAKEDAVVWRFQTTRPSSQPTLFLKAPQQATLRLYALGQVQAYRGQRAVTTTDLTYSKARELLFFLLTHGPSTKEQIALALWPDAPPDYLKNTFRVVVYHLRRALGHAGWLVRDQHYYTFNRSLDYWYDVEAFDAAAQEASRQQMLAPVQAVALLEAAQALYHGDFWEGVMASEWIAWEQARLERKYLEVLLTLGELYRTQGTTQLALETFLRAIERDRYCEEAHRGAIRCYLQLSEPNKARQHVERLRQDLKEHLGFSPATETLALLGHAQE